MKIAIVMATSDSAAMGNWLATNNIGPAELERWIFDAEPDVAEQVLDALVSQWQQTPVDMLIFPAGILGDELATRLAWRLQGGCVCQALSVSTQEGRVTKSHWGNALIATLEVTARPLCLSLARQPGVNTPTDLPADMTTRHIAPAALPDWLISVESVKRSGVHPLQEAKQVLVVGQGGEGVDADNISVLARNLGAEAGYSRARVMNGGYDAERLIGISGHLLAADVCIVAGASGAAALMTGVRDSRFIVAINRDPSAPVFTQADVGIVDDWLPVLDALVACADISPDGG
ncbi:electron transfer flavoprotein subunit alpha/FixB family protein [Klebsiella huaxiensis]|uniref:Electron transfer flavoprotein subunit alpha/FixB family protein n=1 Tax=Klebsiella huaxiensis TaxID=2153354 RepID=A0ABT6EMM8_9ENTR|nr:electron transfer flavoprotein subunit alpha/FixB family protein [Klebsiella huaxiensis]MDG1645062.1 electron transfer flavoprotein subunit alpha/FixB family protein [Klebsiella huaxiensis]QBG11028.1 electron transfer flavoprotein subunit alpha/FixB family protein [Klebsiella huaxiensis]VUS79551.1 Electron transfer flavoprotein subunit alpha [Klebsiella huaxiensis]